MAPTKVGEEVLDLVIPYIHNVEDRNSVSLVSRKLYEIDGITRKRITVHVLYCPNPASLSKRFPFIQSLTLKGRTSSVFRYIRVVTRVTPWIEQLALKFRCLKELHICHLVVLDEDLETLVRKRGKDLRSLKIKRCIGFSAHGLMHVSKYCNQLRSLCLKYHNFGIVEDGIWVQQLALNSTVLERLHVNYTNVSYAEHLTLLARNCCNSLKSLKLGMCNLNKLGDAFRYAVRLERFGLEFPPDNQLVSFQFPLNMRSLSIKLFPVIRYSIVLPFLNQIRKLNLAGYGMDLECQFLLFESCPNLEVLYTVSVSGDRGLQVIGKFCKKLRKLTYDGLATHVGLIALAKGCTKLECLKISLEDISNEAIMCLGVHLKNLRKLRMNMVQYKLKVNSDLTLDNGILAMLMGCRKLEMLDITLWNGGLTDVGLENIGKYGANLRSLSLTRIGELSAGLLKLLQGCPRLRKLTIMDCPFRKQVVASIVFNIPSLRYVWIDGGANDRTVLTLTRPELERWKEQVEKEVSQQLLKCKKRKRVE